MTAFEVLADPRRRLILDLLLQGEMPVGELVDRVAASQPAVSKHLKVLREAGFVSSRVAAQRRLYSINPEPLAEVGAWIDKYRSYWTERLDALEAQLEEED